AAQRLTLTQDGREQHVLVDVDSGSWAAMHEQHGRWTVRQDGPDLLWDAVEDQLGRWRASGAPPLEQCTVHIAPEGQTIRW
ncbi:ATP-grasp peptide maturase system methyltransferase, partial [Streptomyces sp. NPDC003996]